MSEICLYACVKVGVENLDISIFRAQYFWKFISWFWIFLFAEIHAQWNKQFIQIKIWSKCSFKVNSTTLTRNSKSLRFDWTFFNWTLSFQIKLWIKSNGSKNFSQIRFEFFKYVCMRVYFLLFRLVIESWWVKYSYRALNKVLLLIQSLSSFVHFPSRSFKRDNIININPSRKWGTVPENRRSQR